MEEPVWETLFAPAAPNGIQEKRSTADLRGQADSRPESKGVTGRTVGAMAASSPNCPASHPIHRGKSGVENTSIMGFASVPDRSASRHRHLHHKKNRAARTRRLKSAPAPLCTTRDVPEPGPVPPGTTPRGSAHNPYSPRTPQRRGS